MGWPHSEHSSGSGVGSLSINRQARRSRRSTDGPGLSYLIDDARRDRGRTRLPTTREEEPSQVQEPRPPLASPSSEQRRTARTRPRRIARRLLGRSSSGGLHARLESSYASLKSPKTKNSIRRAEHANGQNRVFSAQTRCATPASDKFLDTGSRTRLRDFDAEDLGSRLMLPKVQKART